MKTSHIAVLIIILFSVGKLQAQFNPKEEIFNKLKIHQELKPQSGNDNLERIGEWPYGSSFSVAVDSVRNINFLGSGGAVLILDGTDKTKPQLITDTIRTAGLV